MMNNNTNTDSINGSEQSHQNRRVKFGDFGDFDISTKISYSNPQQAFDNRNKVGHMRIFGQAFNPFPRQSDNDNGASGIQSQQLQQQQQQSQQQQQIQQQQQSQPSRWAGLFGSNTASANASGVAVHGTQIRQVMTNGSVSSVNSQQRNPLSIQTSEDNAASLVNSNLLQGQSVQMIKLYEIVKNYKVAMHNYIWLPRGLINRGNMCYMNSVLQALLYCAPMYHLLDSIAKSVPHDFKSKTPLIDSLIMFIQEFAAVDASQHQHLEHEMAGAHYHQQSFLPEYVYDALRADKRFNSQKGQQEDAEEFLGFLLDGLHEEFLLAASIGSQMQQLDDTLASPTSQSSRVSSSQQPSLPLPHGSSSSQSSSPTSESGGWVEIGARNRPALKRNVSIPQSPITRMFGGQLRSILKAPGTKDSITIEPFYALQLDITPEGITTLESAILNLSKPEQLEEYQIPSGKKVTASKQLFIEQLPPVLILHLKRFIYENGETQKVRKSITYPLRLKITPASFSPVTKPTQSIHYQLFGVVYHHGKSATGGHYTCAVKSQFKVSSGIQSPLKRPNDSDKTSGGRQSSDGSNVDSASNNLDAQYKWLHFDDTLISHVDVNKVLESSGDRNEYILFYIRSSLLSQVSNEQDKRQSGLKQ
ncbi:hypothetical protein MIR68_004747 [Amoeboaphelidium protococcarum]|nr:hypothetical protein MIR68_004747 [Amoeboaphelidium protococcarum]